jgi:hypothetical protein
MAQAKDVSTTIRELMSRGQPSKSTSPVRRAHTELVAALAGNVPHAIYADVDSEDLDGRANHLEEVFASLHVYVTSIIADTTRHIPGGTLDRRYLDNLFEDLSADALGVIRNAGEEMREHENWRAS